jgi:hypothetical protein
MSKSLLEAFKSLDPTVKEALADISSPLILSFAAIDLAYHTCNIESLTAEHITACLEAAGVFVKKESVLRSLARAGDRISPKETIDGEISYRLMTKGKRELPDLLSETTLSVVRVEAGKPRTARFQLGSILSKLNGIVKICDPYYGIRSFDSLDEIPKGCTIKFLSVNASDKGTKLSGVIKDFKRENPGFELRILKPPISIHDRYIITEKELLLLGHGLKDIGSKESFMIRLEADMAKDLIKELNTSFDNLWNKAQVV